MLDKIILVKAPIDLRIKRVCNRDGKSSKEEMEIINNQVEEKDIIKNVDFVIGNSSSGIIEAPSFSIPTINLGDRQKGRYRAKSIIDCPIKLEEIISSIYATSI